MDAKAAERTDSTADNLAGVDAGPKAETQGAQLSDTGSSSGSNDWSSELRTPEIDRPAEAEFQETEAPEDDGGDGLGDDNEAGNEEPPGSNDWSSELDTPKVDREAEKTELASNEQPGGSEWSRELDVPKVDREAEQRDIAAERLQKLD